MTRSRKNISTECILDLRTYCLSPLTFDRLESLSQFSCYCLDFPKSRLLPTFNVKAILHGTVYNIDITRSCTHKVDVTGRVTSITTVAGGRMSPNTFFKNEKRLQPSRFVIMDDRKIARDSLKKTSFLIDAIVIFVLKTKIGQRILQHNNESAMTSRRHFSIRRISRIPRGRGRGARIDPGN